MSALDPLVLKSELDDNLAVLQGIYTFFIKALEEDVPKLGRNQSSALIIAGIAENYYTCLETGFFRVSQFFENNLSKEHWHSDLLHKMSIAIDTVRIAVLSPQTASIMDELLRFRHFKRYYYRLEFDWDRIDFLVVKLRQVHPMILEDLKRFTGFLAEISAGQDT